MLRIIKDEEFKRVYTDKELKRGSVVLYLLGKEYKRPTVNTIQIDYTLHILDPIGREVMHSLDPSCTVEDGKLIALYDLKKDREVTINYYDCNEIIVKPFIDYETKELICTKNNPNYGLDD